MAQKWKTFQPNEILTAADVNDALNPDTADHIPRAMATGSVNGANTSLNVTFPAGRFSSPPAVVASLQTSAGAHNYNTPKVYGVTKDGCKLLVNNGTENANYTWIAVLM